MVQSTTIDDVAAFLLVEGGMSAATAEAMARTLRRLARLGLDVDAAQDPAVLARRGRAILAPMKAAGRVHPFNNATRAMNAVADFYGYPHPFKTVPVRDPGLKPYSADEVVALMAYRFPANRLIEKRRRALIWWGLHTGMRRSEVAGLNVGDLRPASGTFWLLNPAKGGPKRRLPVEPELFSPKRPLSAWLRARPVPARDPEALWTSRVRGGAVKRMTAKGLGRESVAISKGVGVTFNFTRSRHHHATRLLRGNVSVRYIQIFLGHANLATTARYAEANPADMEAAIHAAPVPPVLKQGRPRRMNPGTGGNPNEK